MYYGTIRHLPLPAEVPDIPQFNLAALFRAYIWWKTPWALDLEMNQIATASGRSKDLVLFYNLHYEISGGGCISAALPEERGYLFHRQLHWHVGYQPWFMWTALTPTAVVRYTPGFVGALSGATTQWQIAMNAAPGLFDKRGPRYGGRPSAWILREALARGANFEQTMAWLLQQVPVRQTYVTLVADKRAVWIELNAHEPSRIKKLAEWPTSVIVGNDDEELARVGGNMPERLTIEDARFQGQPGSMHLDRYTVRAGTLPQVR
jgi:hypothetical protein